MLDIVYVLPDAGNHEWHQHGRFHQVVPMGHIHNLGMQLLVCHLGDSVHVGKDDRTVKP